MKSVTMKIGNWYVDTCDYAFSYLPSMSTQIGDRMITIVFNHFEDEVVGIVTDSRGEVLLETSDSYPDRAGAPNLEEVSEAVDGVKEEMEDFIDRMIPRDIPRTLLALSNVERHQGDRRRVRVVHRDEEGCLMNTMEVVDMLRALLDEVGDCKVRSFKNAKVITDREGFVVAFKDGSRFQVTVTQDRRAEGGE